MNRAIRVRFAPSPTGGLHLGGVRTALYNYLFARKNNGTFILRIEDTDQSRFVPGAEEYILECLKWCGIEPDESVLHGGALGPYRQSERKDSYKQYAEQLVRDGYAYYAFDTPEELEQMRDTLKSADNPNPQYDKKTRMQMRNSLSLSADDVQQLLAAQTPYVVRIKVPQDETITFTDIIRGEISNDANLVDDKVLLKADGMPTYHLAVVVDDYLMQISHAFRGEEWLPSAPVHILLWRYLGWEADMPQWAHLPLILKPDGNGKLSKRDGERLGFPVFALAWGEGEHRMEGFKEKGFLPEAFVNLLAMLGWNSGTEQEIFTLTELCQSFSLERVHKGGAKFDYEKAKWYNQQHLLRLSDEELAERVLPFMEAAKVPVSIDRLPQAVAMVKERCHLLTDFVTQAGFLYADPSEIDVDSIKPKWNDAMTEFYEAYMSQLTTKAPTEMEQDFTTLAEQHGLKKGQLMLPLRIMLVGGKYGPGVFDIIDFIGEEATKRRIRKALDEIND